MRPVQARSKLQSTSAGVEIPAGREGYVKFNGNVMPTHRIVEKFNDQFTYHLKPNMGSTPHHNNVTARDIPGNSVNFRPVESGRSGSYF
ncbi:unnamed protein product [Protopolystoma xenopodis]|uniref:Uncharacterized protein n=1 Tax=Protopolystoma xenopodis TaxID=117903 RepID=A0A3S4ZPJ8_9PLAT|nr:unnamed protein product [Protopolystoma xenopodis]